MPESRLPERCRATVYFTGELLLGYLRTVANLCPVPEVPGFFSSYAVN